LDLAVQDGVIDFKSFVQTIILE